jgi:PAS domain S-box-containing protein
VQRKTVKWSGHVSFIKHGNQEVRVQQTIELLSSNKNNLEGTFFKSYITPQADLAQDKLQVYYEMIRHMPIGIGIWRLEKAYNAISSTLRLVCANSLASQYVGVALHVGKDIRDTLPNGADVHQFLEDVIKAQRVSTLEKFRIAYGREVAVTAFPLSQEHVAVALESPKKDNWASVLDTASLGIAVCDNMRVAHSNESFVQMLAGAKEVTGRDAIALLEQYVAVTSRPLLFDLRRAVLESRTHNIEVEIEQCQWGVCVHPLSETFKSFIMLSYRNKTKTTPVVHRGTFPILPHLREALPLPPNAVKSQPQSPQVVLSIQHPPSENPLKSSSGPDSSGGLDYVFQELVNNFPCGIAIVKAERHQDGIQFRIISINRAARVFSNQLVAGKCFDERAPSPFDAAFVRLLLTSYQNHERRVAGRLNLYGSYLSLAARTIPLRDHCIGIAFEEASVVVPQSSYSQFPAKRTHSEIDCGHQILPVNKHPNQSSTPSIVINHTPQSQHSTASPSAAQHAPTLLSPKHEASSPAQAWAQGSPENLPARKLSRQLAPSLLDIERLSYTLPKPFLPPIHSSPASISHILSSRENFDSNVFQSCVIGLACCDGKGQISAVNRSFNQLIGYADSELVDKSFLSVLSTEDAEAIKLVLQQLVNGDSTPVDMPLRLLHKHSHPMLALATIVPHKAHGERPSVLIQVQQADRLYQFPEVLFADKEVLRLVLRQLSVGCAVLDVGNPATPSPLGFVYSNPALCDILGSSEEELGGRCLSDVIHADDRDKTTKLYQDMLASKVQQNQLVARLTTKSGCVSSVLSLTTVANSKAKPFLLIVQVQVINKEA